MGYNIGAKLLRGLSGFFADVTKDNELKVLDGSNVKITQPISLAQGFSTVRDKINYTVPEKKIFHITGWTVTLWKGKMAVEFRINGTIFDGAGLNQSGSTFASRSVAPQTPIATATTGQIVDVFRHDGSSGNHWFVSIQGYLLDI